MPIPNRRIVYGIKGKVERAILDYSTALGLNPESALAY